MSPDFLDRTALDDLQASRLRDLLAVVLPDNAFYARKFAVAGLDHALVQTPADLARLPFTTKAELVADQTEHPPYGSGLTFSRDRYHRLHQTSGTAGRALCWLDTPDNWHWLLSCWHTLYRIAGVGDGERLFFPFSFGPFLGFWTAFEAATHLGYLCLPGGGLSSGARLHFLLDHAVTVVLSTPTYALHLAEVARHEGIDLRASSVRTLMVMGEPGGSIPATRNRIEHAWNARVIDHSGLTEVGPVAIECRERPGGLHILETDYLAEIVEPATAEAVLPGQVGELVLTNLGRWGSPVLRYRTGDLVRVDPQPCACGRSLLRIEGGILGRVDDMIHLRGNNFYPTALEAVLHRFPEVVEYRVTVDQSGPLAELRVEIEPAASAAVELVERVSRAIRDELLFRADVTLVAPGTLPRFEMKARRVVRRLKAEN